MPEKPGTIQFTADRGDGRRRLDQILVRRITGVSGMSRSRAQRWIASGAVAVDGIIAQRASARVREGASIELTLLSSVRRKVVPAAEPRDLDVVFEDEYLIAVNKPAGLVVHPAYRNQSGTLLNAILWRLRDRETVRPGLVTRLDKGTSGLVLIALTPVVHARIQRDAAAGRVTKEYLAIVRGTPRPRRGRITLPLARDPADRRRVISSERGVPSETRYEVIQEESRFSLVRCELVTGRTHQIRVHLAARGWPILGDSLYGESDERLTRHALHAWRVTFFHPVTRSPLHLEARPPDDMRRLLDRADLKVGP
jgi:23S rRNA pseudouridine1911/1915/1917 synthase